MGWNLYNDHKVGQMFYVNAKLLKQFGKRVAEGTTLFNEGEEGCTMFVVHRGKVRISKIIDGQPQTLVVLGEGQFFGEMAILNAETRSATATVAKNSELLEIPAAGFELLMQKSPEMAIQLIKGFSGRLADTNKMLNVLFYQDDYTRMLLLLKNLAEQKVAQGDQLIRIQVDPQAVASQLNIGVDRVRSVVEQCCRAEVLVSDKTGYRVDEPVNLRYFLRYIHNRQTQ